MKMATVFAVATAALTALATILLVWGDVYETAVGCVCCGVILAMAGLTGWAAWIFWKEEQREDERENGI